MRTFNATAFLDHFRQRKARILAERIIHTLCCIIHLNHAMGFSKLYNLVTTDPKKCISTNMAEKKKEEKKHFFGCTNIVVLLLMSFKYTMEKSFPKHYLHPYSVGCVLYINQITRNPISVPQLCEHSDHGVIIHSNFTFSRSPTPSTVILPSKRDRSLGLKPASTGSSFSVSPAFSISAPKPSPFRNRKSCPFELLKV